MKRSDTKYQLSLFPMFDYRDVEQSLTEMAAKGWRIQRAGGLFWKYKRAEPSNSKFCVVYSGGISDYKPAPVETQQLLEELCREGGWEKEIQWKQMQIFSADEETAPLETDEAVRIDSVCRAINKAYLPSWIVGLAAMLTAACFNGMRCFADSPYGDEGALWAFLMTLYAAFIFGFQILGYLFWVKFSKRSILEGGTCVSASRHRRLQNGLLMGVPVLLAGYLADTRVNIGGGLLVTIILVMMVSLAGVSLLNLFSQYLKEKGCSYGVNAALSGTAAVLLIILTAVLLRVMGA